MSGLASMYPAFAVSPAIPWQKVHKAGVLFMLISEAIPLQLPDLAKMYLGSVVPICHDHAVPKSWLGRPWQGAAMAKAGASDF